MFLLNPFTFDLTTIDWKVIGTLITIVLALIGLFYFQWWRNRKMLSYETLSNVLVVSAEEEIRDQVEIHYAGELVKNVRVIVIKLINDGYQPIKKDDFQKPIKFTFPDAKILTAERVKLNPENLEIETRFKDNWVTISPTLFNRKDYVQFKLLLSGYNGMKIDARIVGVSDIEKVNKLGMIQWLDLMLPIFAMGMLVFQFGRELLSMGFISKLLILLPFFVAAAALIGRRTIKFYKRATD